MVPSMSFGSVGSKESRAQWQKLIDNTPPGPLRDQLEAEYERELAEYNHSRNVKRGLKHKKEFDDYVDEHGHQQAGATPKQYSAKKSKGRKKKAIESVDESRRIVPVGAVVDRNREFFNETRPEAKRRTEIEDLHSRERRINGQLTDLNSRLDRLDLSQPKDAQSVRNGRAQFDFLDSQIDDRIRELARVQQRIRDLGGAPAVSAEKALKSSKTKLQAKRDRLDKAERKYYENVANQAPKNAKYESWQLVPVSEAKEREYFKGSTAQEPPRKEFYGDWSDSELKRRLGRANSTIEMLRSRINAGGNANEIENAKRLLNDWEETRNKVLKELNRRPGYKQEQKANEFKQKYQQEKKRNRKTKAEEDSGPNVFYTGPEGDSSTGYNPEAEDDEDEYTESSYSEPEYEAETHSGNPTAAYSRHDERMKELKLAHRQRLQYQRELSRRMSAAERRAARRRIRREIAEGAASAAKAGMIASKQQKYKQATSKGRPRPSELPARSEDDSMWSVAILGGAVLGIYLLTKWRG